ncbi:10853_t:CDS:2 [Paraglomus occultum]|uniref:10853_t:CDS:1 n=1 Tax=Paraglomus occultum TaxID=144539 RepID=A0A9N8VJN0_9GLOM|nr:10853_t:CDS:2 [Paraglomus occultum]
MEVQSDQLQPELIISATPIVDIKEKPTALAENKDENALTAPKEPTAIVDKLKQDLEATNELQNPPPPYSQWDTMDLEQLLQKGREMLTEHDTVIKDGEMLDKMTQLESLVSSLQTILSDQTSSMHDLKSQLSDVQNVLKKMQDKQETITSEEVMKQVVTMKALTENLIASSEIKRQLDERLAAAANLIKPDVNLEDLEVTATYTHPQPQEETTSHLSPLSATPAVTSTFLNTSHTISRQSSRPPSRAPSRPSSRVPSRAVSPSRAPSLSATTAVEAPVKGREKKFRQLSTASVESRDIFEDFDWEGFGEEIEEEEEPNVDETKKKVESVDVAIVPRERKSEKREHRRQKSKKEEEFADCMASLDKQLDDSLTQVTYLINEVMDDEDSAVTHSKSHKPRELMVNYADSTHELINNPSGDLADLDDFAQQCRLVTRAIILPFLHATHSFMSESLQATNNPNAPRTVTSTTRTFMNLMYWTFLFTLGSLVLDAWLCEVAGRQVIRMVDMLKPTQPFGLLNNGYGNNYYNPYVSYNSSYDYQSPQDSPRTIDDGKKKNVNFPTRPKIKAVAWSGIGKQSWWRASAAGVWSFGKRSGRFLTSDWFDSSEEDDDNSEDELTITKSTKRAGHVRQRPFKNSESNEEGIMSTNGRPIVRSCDNHAFKQIEKSVNQYMENCYDSGMNIANLTKDHHSASLLSSPIDDDEIELDIPGSFPAAFRWTPSTSYEPMTEEKENVRRVRSVIIRRPSRGPFGEIDGWVMKTAKIRSGSEKDSARNSMIAKKRKRSSTVPPARTWVRRNSL